MNEQKNKEENLFGEVISRYGIEEATDDGYLVETKAIYELWKGGPISHITNGLFQLYSDKDSPSLPSLNDLFNQSIHKINELIKKNGKDSFWSFKVKDRNGNNLKIFASVNETNKLTLMLPEEY